MHRATVTQSDGWTYYLVRNGTDYAQILLHPPTGQVLVASSYGTWSHFWSHRGEKALDTFLVGLDFDYVHGKFIGRPNTFDLWESCRSVRRFTIEARREQSLTAAQARELYEAAGTAEMDSSMYVRTLSKTDAGRTIPDIELAELVHFTHDPRFENFWKYLWKPFTEHIASLQGAV